MDLGHLLFSFNGRIRRTNYWLGSIGAGFVLGIIMMVIMMIFFGGAAMMAQGGGDSAGAGAGAAGLGIVGVLLMIAVIIFMIWIGLALQVKRWHDRDKSGTWVFIALIPVVGPFWALIELGFLDGTMGPNRFGPSPKGITGPAPAVTTAAPPPMVSG